MTELQTRKKAIRKLVKYMDEKLARDANKGHWKTCSLEHLMERLEEELAELRLAMCADEPTEAIWRETADVANFAMMIADNYERGE